jgi:hypothetical protein
MAEVATDVALDGGYPQGKGQSPETPKCQEHAGKTFKAYTDTELDRAAWTELQKAMDGSDAWKNNLRENRFKSWIGEKEEKPKAKGDEKERFSFVCIDAKKKAIPERDLSSIQLDDDQFPVNAIVVDLEAVEEQVKTIMNQAEPTFLNVTVNKIKDEVYIPNKDTLESVVKSIFDMISNDAVDDHKDDCSKHARCGETYADILFSLRIVVPTFDMDGGGKPMTFTRILLNATQDSFEAMCQKFTEAEKQGKLKESPETVNNLIAVVSFIGHLYVRRLVAARVMAQVVHDLIGVRDRQPEQTLIRCVCELMQVIGKAIDANKQGNMLMTQFLARLSNLAASRKRETQEAIYTQDIRDCIKAVHEARFQHWPARAGTQVLVQYHIISKEDAIGIWKKLQEMKQLPVEDMCKDMPTGANEETGQSLRISGVISGRDIAVILGKNVETLKEAPFKDEISNQTSIHASRLMVFKDDGCLLEDLGPKSAPKPGG